MKFLIILNLLLSFRSQAKFLPEGDIKTEALIRTGPSQTTEENFNKMISNAQKIYVPIAKNLGGRLNISGNWKDETPNAFARQMFGEWRVDISGGLARRPELSTDGLTLILCHEIGHHLGGFAFKSNGPIPVGAWAASEGQADYFATHVCLRKLWQDDVQNNVFAGSQAREDMYRSCSKTWTKNEDLLLCLRILMASESVALTMASLKGETTQPRFTTPDTSIVNRTNQNHPATQCRMDTLFQGALCTAQFDDQLIPGKKVRGGVFSENAEKESARVSCTQFSSYKIGLRPACWFKARF